MAVAVMRTIASRGLRISGSRTFSTRTSSRAVPANRFHNLLLPNVNEGESLAGKDSSEASPTSRVRRCRLTARLRAAGGLPFSGGNLARFHELLEAVQIFVDLLAGLFAPQLRHQRSEHAGGRIVLTVRRALRCRARRERP